MELVFIAFCLFAAGYLWPRLVSEQPSDKDSGKDVKAGICCLFILDGRVEQLVLCAARPQATDLVGLGDKQYKIEEILLLPDRVMGVDMQVTLIGHE